ncbi:hypothetical protein MKW92_049681 [Papaver armeniacum]|nr:hypothetical protein MKW92_049681 [Papaver armeniacum]
MGKKEQEHLNRILVTHLNTMHETFQLLEDAPPSSLEKVDWQDVVTLGGQVSKQATIAGMLWSGAPNMKELEENMGSTLTCCRDSFCWHTVVRSVQGQLFRPILMHLQSTLPMQVIHSLKRLSPHLELIAKIRNCLSRS